MSHKENTPILSKALAAWSLPPVFPDYLKATLMMVPGSMDLILPINPLTSVVIDSIVMTGITEIVNDNTSWEGYIFTNLLTISYDLL